MTIAGSLANALSGLTATTRAAELVSANVANAMTEGYGRREIELSTRYVGGAASAGVNVVGVRREVDNQLIQDRRLVDARAGQDGTRADFYQRLETAIGTPGSEGSLTDRVDALEAALIEARSRPDNQARLAAVLDAAQGLASHLNDTSDTIQKIRMDADSGIDAQVGRLNDGLQRVHDLNVSIKEVIARGQDASALYDMRQQTIDSISEIVPLKQVDRDHGMVALYTTGGAIVLDGRPVEIGFSSVGVIVPEMTQAGGGLSGLTVNGRPVRTDGSRSPIAGGTLAALFQVRDEFATDAQGQLDSVARDLVERFQDPAVDTTLTAGDAGLFTDGGGAFDSADELGLSARIGVNALADPENGGALWRLRDGLGAVTQGDVGNATLIARLQDTLASTRAPSSGDFAGVAHSASGLAAGLISAISSRRTDAENQQAYSAAQLDNLTQMELEAGVDSDQEMQKLMLIEQAFTANAKVINTVGAMIDTLMEL